MGISSRTCELPDRFISGGNEDGDVEGHIREYLRLNKNLIIAFLSSLSVSAFVAQQLSLQAKYLNSSATLAVDLSVYYAAFSGLFYVDNRRKYLLESGKLDSSRLKTDLVKLVTSLGSSEIVYGVCRWLVQYYMLSSHYEAYLASAVAQSASFLVYLASVNLIARSMRLYREKN